MTHKRYNLTPTSLLAIKQSFNHKRHSPLIKIVKQSFSHKRHSPLIIRGKSVRSWCDGSSDRSFMVDPLSYFSIQPLLHDWYNKGRGMCYPVCGMMHIKEPLLLIGKSSPYGGSGFSLSRYLSGPLSYV